MESLQMIGPVKYESGGLIVEVDPDNHKTKLIFTLLNTPFEVIDNSIDYQRYHFDTTQSYKNLAKRIHDNIMIDGMLYRQLKTLLTATYKAKLWRFIK